jgi:sigma-B regulation protein RsbU (phosphoserine phosphatase)
VLRTLVERCIELRRRREDHRQNLVRLETEMAGARAFQQSLLPSADAIVNQIAICCRYTPYSGLGGDLYDYAAAPGGRTALLVADVSGHGVSAAMLTGIVKSAFYASHADGFEPAAVVRRVSGGLAPFSAERFVTLVAALICPEQRQLRYVNAGHPPVALWGDGGRFTWLDSTGPLISPVLMSATWEMPVVPMQRGDHLLLYTDGISDTLADGDGCGEERLAGAISRVGDGGAPLLDAILTDVARALAGRPQPDDFTLLTATVASSAGS